MKEIRYVFVCFFVSSNLVLFSLVSFSFGFVCNICACLTLDPRTSGECNSPSSAKKREIFLVLTVCYRHFIYTSHLPILKDF